MKTHLQTAHEYGVQKALEKCGYASIEDVQKEASALGLTDAPNAKTGGAADPLASLFQKLDAKLG